MELEESEILKIIHSAEFIENFGIRTRKDALVQSTLLDPLADTIIKDLMKSGDPKERQKGLELHLKRQEQLGVKDVDIRKDFGTKTNPDDLLKDTWALFSKLINYSWAQGKEVLAVLTSTQLGSLRDLKKKAPPTSTEQFKKMSFKIWEKFNEVWDQDQKDPLNLYIALDHQFPLYKAAGDKNIKFLLKTGDNRTAKTDWLTTDAVLYLEGKPIQYEPSNEPSIGFAQLISRSGTKSCTRSSGRK